MSNIDIHSKYIPLFNGNTRYYIVTGGRGSGKSFGVNVFLNQLVYEAGHKVLFTRYTMTSAHTSIIPEFVEKIDLMGASAQFRVTRDEIINIGSGSSIMFKGIKTSSGNQTAALKSLSGVTTFVVDEAEELVDESVFDKIDLSVRSNTKQNRVILIMNPATKEHWIYKRFFEDKGVEAGFNGVKGNTTYIHTTYKDNASNLPESFLQSVFEMKLKNPDKYEHTMLGGWLNKADGTVYSNWRTGDYIQLGDTCYGQDFGWTETDLTTLVQISVDSHLQQVFVREVYGKPKLKTSEIARLNKRHAGNDLIIADNHEPRVIAELKDYGVNVKKAEQKQGSIVSGIALLQDYEIIVDRNSKGIQRELNNYVWKDNGKPIDKYNHYLDAIRYAFWHLRSSKNKGKYVIS